MKCTKCGNEIKDDVKFCPNCGEEVKEEKKIKFCMKCGSELMPDSMFCSECGASIAGEQKKEKSPKPNKPVKKVLGVIGILVVLVLIVGCFMINSDKAMYKAYAEFHDEYCDKNLKYEELNDCTAKIIMSPDNKKWLAIYDVINASYDDGYVDIESSKDKITLYRYSWGKVKKVSTFSKEFIGDGNFTTFSVIDNELYLFLTYRTNISKDNKLEGVYVLNENNIFKAVNVKEVGKDDDIKYIMDSGIDLQNFLFLGNGFYEDRNSAQLSVVNNVRSTNVSEFTDILEELAKYKIKNQVDLQIAYGKILKEFGVHPAIDEYYDKPLSSDYPVVGTMKTEYGYYYVRTSGNVALAGLTEKNDFYKALKSADGRKVTGIEYGGYTDIPKNLKIPDNITYIGKYTFDGQEQLESVEIPDSLERIGNCAFRDCNLQQIELPDSIEKIGSGAFDVNININVSVTISPIIIASEGSYAHQYAEENDLEWSAKELSKKELEERKLIGEALDAYNEWIEGNREEVTYSSSGFTYGDFDYKYITMCYLDNDNIPECIVWYTDRKDMSIATTFFVLSYKNGEIVKVKCDSTDSGYKEFFYTPRSGNFIYTLWNHVGRGREIYNLSNDFVRTDEIAVSLYRGEEKFIINGEAVDSEETVEKYVRDKGFTHGITEKDLYQTVKEAYQNLT